MAASARFAVTDELLAEEPRHARVEFAVKGCPVEARRHVRANARDGGPELPPARAQECEVAGRHDMDFGVARKDASDARRARTVADARTSQLGSPVLQRDLDRGQIVSRKNPARGIDNHGGLDTRVLWRAGPRCSA